MSDDNDELLMATLRDAARNMGEEEWREFTAEVRPPNSVEQFKAAAAKVLSGAALDAFADAADLSKFANDSGDIDKDKVMGHLTAMFGTQTAAGGQHNWGQHSGSSGQGLRPGDAGRAEAARRAGRQPAAETEGAAASTSGGRGAGGREEAQRRFGKKGIDK